MHLKLNFMSVNSQNNNKLIQSAGNLKTGSSETTRQLSNALLCPPSSSWFAPWLAGVLDGDANFDVRKISGKLKLKAIRIKLHVRDVKILNIIQNQLHFGRINHVRNKPYCIFIVSTIKDMSTIVNLVNGSIRLKVDGFKKACDSLNIAYCEANYKLQPMDPYFAGLIDTDGSIVFNYASNRIECNVELKNNEYSQKLNLDEVIPQVKPSIAYRNKSNQTSRKFKSISFKFQTVKGMIFVYEYFMKNRLYCDMKFYRISKIKPFLALRHYHNCPSTSLQWRLYRDFVLDFIQHRNAMWHRVPFVKKLLDKDIVHKRTH